jgi:hypothetical protein
MSSTNVVLTAALAGALLCTPAAAQRPGTGTGPELLLQTSALPLQITLGAKKFLGLADFAIDVASPLGSLAGAPLIVGGDLRPRNDYANLVEIPGAPLACALSWNLFLIADGLTGAPAIVPGQASLDTPSFHAVIPVPDLSPLRPLSLWIQAATLAPFLPSGLALSKVVRHDTDFLDQRATVTVAAGASALAGYSLEAADLVGDGRAELILGVPQADPAGVLNAGSVRVLDGSTGVPLLTLTASTPQANAWFGSVVHAADLEGDGHPELLVGARLEDVGGLVDAGAAYIFPGPSLGAPLRLTSSAPGAGFRFGQSIQALDWNGDGVKDLAIGSPKALAAGQPQAGVVEIFDGLTLGLLALLSSPAPQALAKFGYGLAAADFDGDGREDLVVGEPFHDEDPMLGDDSGRVWVFLSGAPSSQVLLATGFDAQAVLGHVVRVADLDQDGLPDVVAAAEFSDLRAPDAGAVFVFHGLGGGAFGPAMGQAPASLAPGEGFGSDVVVGDTNSDGIPDLVVGSFYATVSGQVKAGRGFVGLGPTFEQWIEIRPSAPLANAEFGRRVALGDVDGDGFGDALFSAPLDSPGGVFRQGSATVAR